LEVYVDTRIELDTSRRVRQLATYGLAAAMVIGPAVQVLLPLLQPWPLSDDDYVGNVSAHPDAYRALSWLALLGALTMAPAVVGIGLVAFRGAPRLALTGTVLALPSMLNPDGNPGDLIYTATRAGLPREGIRGMLDRLGDLAPFTTFGFYAFAVAFAVGGLVLGVALLVGRSAPRWAAMALLLASATALVGSWVNLGGLIGTVAWAVATVGFAGCAIALVKPLSA
jgi:hypothetical protein